MERRDLIDLFYTAYDRFQTVQMTWQYWLYTDMMRLMQERLMAQHAKGSIGMLVAASGKERNYEQVTRVNRRVWWRKPDCWRDEYQWGAGGTNVTILCKGNWWNFSAGGDSLITNVMPKEQWSRLGIREVREGNPPDLMDRLQDVPLLDPSFLLVSHDLQPIADTLYLGREAIEVRALYRKAKTKIHENYFWTTADEYDFLVDKEHGILLRYAALLDGQEFAVSSVDSVVFDAPIPDEVFAFPTDS